MGVGGVREGRRRSEGGGRLSGGMKEGRGRIEDGGVEGITIHITCIIT